MQTLAAGVWRTLSAAAPQSVLLAHRGPNWALPWWVPSAVLRAIWLVKSQRVDMVLTGDALMYAAVSPVLRLLRTPCSTMVLGLDMTYDNRAYRAVVYPALRRAEHVIAISEATAAVARDLGVPPDRVYVVPLGVDAPEVTPEQRAAARESLHERLGTRDEQLLLLTLGRLVRRKGVVWFLRSVLPELPRDVVYVVAGDGDDAERVRDTVGTMELRDRVRLLGEVDDSERELLLLGTDLFVQPNIPVPGDIEGFGLVTIEAAMRGLPVLAADLEGISEAVVDGVTGRLLPSGDADAWVAELTSLAANRNRLATQGLAFQEAARARYSERLMGEELVRLLGLQPDRGQAQG
jgi:phosphatidylinositol alpha-1,6-mannosyltransferase